jgi:SAM-dependent methyltransferase
MPLAFGAAESHPMVDAFLAPRLPRWQELNRAVDERDDMLDFAVKLFEHDRDAAVSNYFQNGYEQFELVRHIASWRAGQPKAMLDFASGYGRLTRFLVHQHLADEVTVSDILEGGMEFQAAQFGVRTILSTTLPEQFPATRKYDLIFVASLFTHLPPATFTAWLRKLATLLENEGLLIFSVHDESIAPVAVDGIAFESYSESRVLDGSEYGSTWVTEGYVREQVAAIDPGFACVRLPRALSDWQDVYVISPQRIAEPRPRRMPKGFLDQFEITDESLRFSGWATVLGDPVDRVEVKVNNELAAATREFHERGDVADWLQIDAARHSGWTCLVPHAKVRSFRYDVVTVSAFSAEGVEKILFHGAVESLAGVIAREKAKQRDEQLARRELELDALRGEAALFAHQRDTLAQQIEAMRRSRFWKAREQWFRVKRAAGLTDEA